MPSSSSIAHLSLALLLGISPFSSEALTHNVTIQTTVPSEASKVVDRSFTGFAFEQSSFYNYSFDAQGKPNEFSQNLVDAVLSRTGGTPLLRVGGTSGDHGRFNASQKNATNYPATQYGPQTKISGNRLAIGPSFFKAFNNWPGAKFELMVPFYNTTFSHSVEWARAGIDQIGIDNLYALELGNEPTFYPWFSIKEYVKRFRSLQARLIAAAPSLGDKRIFQAFDTASYAAGDLTTKPAFQDGLNANASSIKQVAYHYYQNQHGVADFAAFQEYIRHTATKSNLTNFLPNIKYLEENHSAIGFAFTETGYTVGGSGGNDHIETNNFASALWSLDFQLCAMSMNVSRVNWQQILRSDLQMWRPVNTSLGAPRVTPHFYSQPFVADFIGKSGKTRVVELDIGTPQNGLYSGYAAYDDGKLARVALLNLELWDSRRSSGSRPKATFSLPKLVGAGSNITVHHLTADNGALAQENLTYSGLEWTWASRGKQRKVKDDSKVLEINGTEINIMVNATQAVLLEIR
ncbi:hypothetical protein O1611_g6003 [Lasiodiplodia mahajangana]|uniref:Uncharacterized protein n=1 Tax=Lasiodiplodia mahajangana TaxID=1108764 RepID=A0ACC2JK82_9PEZI|nr:hypothetical protein O1611_g6003 [Lasiodiplodia mahajangana]